MRINARLDETTQPQLHYLMRETGLSVSDIIKKSLQTYYRLLKKKRRQPVLIFKKTGFIASGKGEKNLSRDYKKMLSAALVKKYDHR